LRILGLQAAVVVVRETGRARPAHARLRLVLEHTALIRDELVDHEPGELGPALVARDVREPVLALDVALAEDRVVARHVVEIALAVGSAEITVARSGTVRARSVGIAAKLARLGARKPVVILDPEVELDPRPGRLSRDRASPERDPVERARRETRIARLEAVEDGQHAGRRVVHEIDRLRLAAVDAIDDLRRRDALRRGRPVIPDARRDLDRLHRRRVVRRMARSLDARLPGERARTVRG